MIDSTRPDRLEAGAPGVMYLELLHALAAAAR